MDLLSLLGIVLGIALFIFLAFRKFNMFLSALLSSLVIMLFSRMPIMETLTGTWMASVTGFLQAFFLIFVFSSLFGQTLSDGKASRSIAIFFAALIRKSKNPKRIAIFFVPLMYSLLSFAGISGFVIVFTVLTMSRDLFQEFDIPWRLYCYGGASTLGTVILGGSLQLTNIMLAEMLGTSLTAGMLLSIVGAIIFYAVFGFIALADLKKAEKNGEGFMKTGAVFKNDNMSQSADEKLPNIWLSVLPIVAVIGIAIFSGQVLIALAIGIALNLILFKPYYKSYLSTLSDGITSGFAPVINVAVTVGISTIIAVAPGFALVEKGLSVLPPVAGGITLIALISFLTASPTGAIPSFGPMVTSNMVASGMSLGAAHRITASSIFTCVGPHSPGVVNTTALSKIEYKDAVGIYMKSSIIPGLAAIIVMTVLASLGIFA